VITDANELQLITITAASLYLILANDINIGTSWTSLGPTIFKGELDGRSHTVHFSNTEFTAKVISGDNYAGIFAQTEYSSPPTTIKNLTATGSAFINDSSTSITYIGVIAGKHGGTVSNCKISVNLTANKDNGTAEVGGIVGRSHYGIVQNCYSSSTIIRNGEGITRIGGIAGSYFDGIATTGIENCYSSGTITRNGSGTGNDTTNMGGITGDIGGYPFFRNCYSTAVLTRDGSGADTDTTRMGGIIGDAGGSVTLQYFYFYGSLNGPSSATTYIGGILGNSATYLHSKCVALNSNINGDSNVGRIAGSASTLSDNYARTNMGHNNTYTLGTTWASVGHTTINGDSVDLEDTQALSGSWWNTSTRWASVWGTSQTAPWQWDSTLLRPKLYWED
jgi:hypothetical protein